MPHQNSNPEPPPASADNPHQESSHDHKSTQSAQISESNTSISTVDQSNPLASPGHSDAPLDVYPALLDITSSTVDSQSGQCSLLDNSAPIVFAEDQLTDASTAHVADDHFQSHQLTSNFTLPSQDADRNAAGIVSDPHNLNPSSTAANVVVKSPSNYPQPQKGAALSSTDSSDRAQSASFIGKRLEDKKGATAEAHNTTHRRYASAFAMQTSGSSAPKPVQKLSGSQAQASQDRGSNPSLMRGHTLGSSPHVKITSSSDIRAVSGKKPLSAQATHINKTGTMERSAAAVAITAARRRTQQAKKSDGNESGKPSHHCSHGGFTNPWPSALKGASLRSRGGSSGSRTFFHKVAKDRRPPDEQLATMLLLALRPDFSASIEAVQKDKYALASTWIGHCTFYLHARGLTVLTDPVWSSRLGPLGTKRLVPPPCNVEDLPSQIDVVILSSACYDHYDKNAIQALQSRVGKWLVPLGVKALLVALDISKDVVVELDWWQEHKVHGSKFVCTPCQHFSNRDDALWCSWAVHAPHHRFFYCGGTGYRSINHESEDSETYDNRARFGGDACPVFKEIGNKLGPFDTAFLPIGGFKPRAVMSGVQGDAVDMLFVHRDIDARRSIAHRWGTFCCGEEGLLDSIRLLEFALQTGPVSENDFVYLKHGRFHLS